MFRAVTSIIIMLLLPWLIYFVTARYGVAAGFLSAFSVLFPIGILGLVPFPHKATAADYAKWAAMTIVPGIVFPSLLLVLWFFAIVMPETGAFAVALGAFSVLVLGTAFLFLVKTLISR